MVVFQVYFGKNVVYQSESTLCLLSLCRVFFRPPWLSTRCPRLTLWVFCKLPAQWIQYGDRSLHTHTFFPSAQLTAPGQLQELGPLIVGMKTETLLSLTSDRLLSSLPAMAQHMPSHCSPQANAVSTKLWVQHTHTDSGFVDKSKCNL